MFLYLPYYILEQTSMFVPKKTDYPIVDLTIPILASEMFSAVLDVKLIGNR
jgi:hypothetical protein